jgi:hypothetical protein
LPALIQRFFTDRLCMLQNPLDVARHSEMISPTHSEMMSPACSEMMSPTNPG